MKRSGYMEILKITNLYKSYKDHKVLNGLDITVHQGEVYGFIGKNGSGKTTTMNIITDLINSDEGTVTLNEGKPLSLGYLPESPSLFTYMNADEYLSYIAACCKYQGDVQKRNDELLTLVDLKPARKRKIKGYSRGMQQRVGLAAAIYADPDLVLLDEPTSALDPQGRAEVIAIIQKLRELGKTVVLSTHILSDIERVCDSVGILKDGKIIIENTLENLFNDYKKSKLFLKPTSINPQQEEVLLSFGLLQTKDGYELPLNGNENSWKELLTLCIQQGIQPDQYRVMTSTLEEIYMEVVG
jgi:ABC-2 type transport system ATP-binding protein